MKSLGIYLHIPFCVKKCAYCDFLSGPAAKEDRLRYLAALKKEINCMQGRFAEYQADTVFFGGGTPSLLEPGQIEELLEALFAAFSFGKEPELTLEANPGTLTEKKLEGYKKIGLNRLSLGLQSADTKELEALGRIHTWEEFLENYKAARKAGFRNINIDIMSALPGQTVGSYQNTLERIIALKPEHISAYSLIIEEGTPFYKAWEKGKLMLPEEETERKMYYLTEELLETAGYQRYEISNYAKPGFESRHNNKYWTGGEYLGLGLGASSCWKDCRTKNTESFEEYIKRAEEGICLTIEQQALTKQEKMEEFMFLGLRRMEGVRKNEFLERFGKELSEVYGEVVKRQENQGVIAQDGERLWLTKRGIDVSNRVMAEYLF